MIFEKNIENWLWVFNLNNQIVKYLGCQVFIKLCQIIIKRLLLSVESSVTIIFLRNMYVVLIIIY